MAERKAQIKDEELVLRSRAGDKKAMDELMHRYGGLARSCARGFFLNGGETEDLTQEGMVGLFNAVLEYENKDGGSSFKNFAYLCIYRRIVDAVKTSLRKKNIPLRDSVALYGNEWYVGENINPEEILILEDERREFKQTMSRVLSDFEFKVTTMYMDGLTYTEICDVTGKDERSVGNAIQRSKRKLQQVLGK